MRTALVLGLILSACSPTPGPDQLKPGECLPAATATQSCQPFDGFHQCRPTEDGERQFLCDLATVRPEVVSSFTCREGIDWRLGFPGSPETCSYARGELVGATFTQGEQRLIAGYWQLHDCVETPLCPERDAGSCLPQTNAYQTCDEDLSRLGFCRPTEVEQRAALCSPDGGASSRLALACDGGVELHEVYSSIGPTDSCVYADGGLLGASTMSDTFTGPAYGRWALEGCVQTTLCP